MIYSSMKKCKYFQIHFGQTNEKVSKSMFVKEKQKITQLLGNYVEFQLQVEVQVEVEVGDTWMGSEYSFEKGVHVAHQFCRAV